MLRVIVESPYAGDVELNLRYVRACMHDCLRRGEAPFASHALYTQKGVLDDKNREDRELGMAAGWSWMRSADFVAVYLDLGESSGMTRGIHQASLMGLIVTRRLLGHSWSTLRT